MFTLIYMIIGHISGQNTSIIFKAELFILFMGKGGKNSFNTLSSQFVTSNSLKVVPIPLLPLLYFLIFPIDSVRVSNDPLFFGVLRPEGTPPLPHFSILPTILPMIFYLLNI